MTKSTYEVAIKFVPKGVNSVENEMAKLFRDFEYMNKAMEAAGLKKSTIGQKFSQARSQVSALVGDLEWLQDVMAQASSKEYRHLPFEEAVSEMGISIEEVVGKFNKLTKGVLDATSSTKAMGQALKNSFKFAEYEIQATIDAMRELGLTDKQISALSKEFKKIKDVSKEINDISPMLKFNNELQKRAELAKEIAERYKKLETSPFAQAIPSSTLTRMADLISETMKFENSVQEIKREFKTLFPETAFKGLVSAIETSKKLKKAIADIGVKDDIMKKLSDSLNKVATQAVQAQNPAVLREFNAELRRRVEIFKKAQDVLSSLKTAKIPAAETKSIEAVANSYKKLAFDEQQSIMKLEDGMKSLLAQKKEILAVEKTRIKEAGNVERSLQKQKEALLKQKTVLDELYQKNKKVMSPEDADRVSMALLGLEDNLRGIDQTLSKISRKKVWSDEDVKQYQKALAETINTVQKRVAAAKEAKMLIGISYDKTELNRVIGYLKEQVQSIRIDSPSIEKKVSGRLAQAQKLISQGEIATGRKIIADVEKRLDILRKVEKIEDSITAKARKAGLDLDVVRKIIDRFAFLEVGDIFDFSKSTKEAQVQVDALANKIKTTFDIGYTRVKKFTSATEKGFKTAQSEIEQLQALAKKSFISSENRKEIEALLNTLKNVEGELKQISRSAPEIALDDSKVKNAEKELEKVSREIDKIKSKRLTIEVERKLGTSKTDLEERLKKLRTIARADTTEEKITLAKTLKQLQDSIVHADAEELKIVRQQIAALEGQIRYYNQIEDTVKNTAQKVKILGNEHSHINDVLAVSEKTLNREKIHMLQFGEEAHEAMRILEGTKAELTGINDLLKKAKNAQLQNNKLLQQYEDQYNSLNRLLKVKELWADSRSKEKAIAELKRLREEIKKVHANSIALDRVINKIGAGATFDDLIIPLGNIRKYQDELGRVKNRAKEVKAALSEMGIAQVFRRALAYASMYTGFYEVFSVMRKGVEYVVEFDKATKTMAAVLDISVVKATALENSLIRLGRAYGGSLKDINSAALALGRAGIATENVVKATEAVIKMAKLTGDSIGVSADAMITYTQVFGQVDPITGKVAYSISQLGDQLAYVANQSRLSTQDIGTFSNYALAAAKAANLSMEAINAMAISFSNAGVNASTIGTQIRRFSSLLRDNSSAVKRFFESIGTSQQFFAARLQYSTTESNKAMLQLVRKLRGLSDQEFAKTIRGMDLLAANSLTLLRNNAAEFEQHFKRLLSGVDGELEKSEYVAESYASSWEKMTISIGQAFQKLSDTVFPFFKSVMDGATEMFSTLSDNMDGFVDKFKTAFGVISLAFAAMTAKPVFAVMALRVQSLIALFTTFSKKVRLLGAVTTNTALKSSKSLGAIAVAISIAKKLFQAFIGIVMRNPIVAAFMAIAAAATYAYNAIKGQAEELKKLSSIEQARAVMKNKEVTIQGLIGEKTKLQIQLEKALNAGQKNRAKLLAEEIGLKEAAIRKAAMEKAEAEKTLEFEEKRLKVSEIQAKITSLKAERKILFKDNSKEALARIAEIDKELEELTKEEYRVKIQVEADLKKEDLFPIIEKALNQINTIIAEGEKRGVDVSGALAIWGAKLNEAYLALAEINGELDEVKDKAKAVGDVALFSLSDKEIQDLSKLQQALTNMFTAKVNIATFRKGLIKTLETNIDEYSKTIKTRFENNMKELKEAMGKTFNSIPKEVKDAMAQVEEAMNSLDTTEGIQQAQLALANLMALFKKEGMAGNPVIEKLLVPMINGINTANNNMVKLHENLKKVKAVGVIDFTKIMKTPYIDSDRAVKAIEEINAAEKTLARNKRILSSLNENIYNTTSDYLDAEDKLIAIREKQMVLGNRYVKVLQEIEALKTKQGSAVSTKKEQEEIEKRMKELLAERDRLGKELHTSAKEELKTQTALTQQEIERKKAFEEFVASYNAYYGNFSKKASQELQKLESDLMLKYKVKDINGKIDPSAKAQFQKEMDFEIQKIIDEYEDKFGMKKPIDVDLVLNAKVDLPDYNPDQQPILDKVTELYQNIRNKIAEQPPVFDLSDHPEVGGGGVDQWMTWGEDKIQQINEFYARVEQAKDYAYGNEIQKMIEHGATMEEIQSTLEQRDLERTKMYAQQKQDIYKAMFDSIVGQAGASLGSLGDALAEAHKAGLVKSRGVFKAMQAMQVGQAIVNTYMAASNALANPLLPPPLNYIEATAQIIKGMALVAQIKAQKFHDGGFVTNNAGGGVGKLKADEVPAILQTGEYVLSRKDIAAIKEVNNVTTPHVEVPQQETVIINSIDPAVVEEWATSRTGRQVIRNIVNSYG